MHIASPLLDPAPAEVVLNVGGRPREAAGRHPAHAGASAARRLEELHRRLNEESLNQRDRAAAVDSLRAHASLMTTHGIELLQRIAAGEYDHG